MHNDEKDYLNERLSQIGREREDMENSFRQTMREIEGIDEELIQSNSALSRRMEEEAGENCDLELMAIYQEREELYKEMRIKALEFDEEIRKQYEERQQELENEELSLRKSVEESEMESE